LADPSPLQGVTSWHPGQTLKSGQTVLVLGTGGVSIYAAQLAIKAGARVIATSSSDEKLERIKKEVSEEILTVNYGKVKEWEKEVVRLTGGRGVDHVIESTLLSFASS
jgi:NADPH:quinone reductase-like Zn-dependent oxidoreductase